MEYRKTRVEYRCFDDCTSLGCPGHVIECVISDEASVDIRQSTNGKEMVESRYYDMHEIEAIVKAFTEANALWK